MTTKRYGQENYIANGMGIPAHDYIDITNNGDGNATQIQYYLGGSGGTLVAQVDMTYDVNGALETVTRSV